jgi:hypothetical protein
MEYLFETMIPEADAKPPKFPIRDTFMEAWNDMYQHVQKCLAAGNLSHQLLETAMWIELRDTKKCSKAPMLFPAARDHAIREYDWSLEKQKAQDAKKTTKKTK